MRKDICAALIIICPGGCQFNKSYQILSNTKTCVVPKCGKPIASIQNIAESFRVFETELTEDYKKDLVEPNKNAVQNFLNHEIYKLPAEEQCADQFYNYTMTNHKIDQEFNNVLCEVESEISTFTRYLPIFVLASFAVLLTVIVWLYFTIKGTCNF
jgi:hypothetical protein